MNKDLRTLATYKDFAYRGLHHLYFHKKVGPTTLLQWLDDWIIDFQLEELSRMMREKNHEETVQET